MDLPKLRKGDSVTFWDPLNRPQTGTIVGRFRQDGRYFYYIQATDTLIVVRLPEHLEPTT